MISVASLEPVLGVDEASRAWGANCGPVAIAAALGVPLDRVRDAVSVGGKFRGYMGVRDLRAAIPRAGGRIVRTWSKPLGPTDAWSFCGPLADATADTDGAALVVLLRFCGPWDGIPRAAATYRHAFAYRRVNMWAPCHGLGSVCDVNNYALDDCAPWTPARTWRNLVMPDLIPERGDERVAVDWIAQVDRG